MRRVIKISVLFSINPGAPCYVAQVYVANPSYGCQKNRKKRQKIVCRHNQGLKLICQPVFLKSTLSPKVLENKVLKLKIENWPNWLKWFPNRLYSSQMDLNKALFISPIHNKGCSDQKHTCPENNMGK